jgi:hypothetical protein
VFFGAHIVTLILFFIGPAVVCLSIVRLHTGKGNTAEARSRFRMSRPGGERLKYGVMHRLILLAILVVLAGCRGTEAYTSQDLSGVKTAEATIVPVYLQFKRDYRRDNQAAIQRTYAQEQEVCKQVDVIDQRDTIDPNVNLFQASAELDDFCNAIESAYVYWAKGHGLPYDKSIVPGRRQEVFLGSDADLKTIHKYVLHPSALS